MKHRDFDVAASRATEPFFYSAPTPPGTTPRQYQLAGVEYALAREHVLFGDAPGVGKTAQCILLGNAIGAKKSIVVCPASLRLNWEREIWRWSMIENVSTYPVLKSSDGVSLEANYVIVSYDLLRNPAILAAVMDQRWDHVILDEAHAIKDPKGNGRTKAICGWMDKGEYVEGISDRADRLTLASGTILPNQPVECLGADTLVLTDSGYKPIIAVTLSDKLWDGLEWVAHEGVVCRGQKATGKWLGVRMTPDHLVLAGENWYGAQSLGAENIRRLALATASENLPLLASIMGKPEACSGFTFAATAGARSTKPAKRTFVAAFMGAARAVLKKASSRAGLNTLALARTCSYGSACAHALATYFPAAITETMRASAHTAVGVSGLPRSGEKTARSSWPIWLRFLAVKTQHWRSTALTWIAAMSREIFGSPLGKKASGEKSTNFSSALMTLSDVYDLVNAGPRRRFTILSNRGPLLVHNCYNAIRLLDWSAIDNASLEDFREYYYDFGGGMVRGRVFDEATQSWKFKLHYSTKVRNVPRNLDDLQYRLRKHIMVRRVKEQVLKELPPKQWHVFPLAITSEIRKALKHPGWAAAQKLYEMDPEAFDHGIPVDGAISTARLELGVAKAAAVADYIDDLMESGVEKMIVAAHHHQVLDYLKGRLQRYGVAYMDGGTSARKKQAEVDRFQGDPDVGIMLGQTQPLGEGWTLTAAQDAVLAEPDWVPGKNDQLVDRLHRMGQKGSYVEAHVPVVPGTLDEKILATAIQKDQHIYAALDKEH